MSNTPLRVGDRVMCRKFWKTGRVTDGPLGTGIVRIEWDDGTWIWRATFEVAPLPAYDLAAAVREDCDEEECNDLV